MRHSQEVSTDPTPSTFVRNGATIGYLSMGTGPSVVVVPGALSIAADYVSFARALSEHFSVHVLERRGRGVSSPQGDDYNIAIECEDVLALQRATNASFLVGHSFGGLVALESARNNSTLRKMALYEPGVSIDGSIRMDWMPRYEQELAQKRYLDALVEFSRGTGPDRGRNTPRWLMKLLLPLFLTAAERERMLALLSENLREHREIAHLDSHHERYRDISADVLLMYGGKSGIAWVPLAIERLLAVLPRAATREFPGLDHFGINKGSPREVARAVGDYFQARGI
jgi:pimeloyl-ACP methyl ester carboxylesterase